MAQDAELAMLLACCRSAFLADAPPVECLAGGPIDGPRFLRLARFHRVEGLVWRGLGAASAGLPPDVAEELRSRAEVIATANLIMARESARLHSAFEAAGIDLLFVKGASLAQLAYGDLGAKSAKDIDILVAPEAIADSARLLVDLGYRPEIPGDSAAIAGWHSSRKESVWVHAPSAIQLDLHTGLADTSALIPAIGRHGAGRRVDIGHGMALPTLRRDELAAYLAVHGASTAWFRLKWIADFAALLEREHRGRLPALREAMRALGAHWAGDQALLLADDLFGSLAGEADLRALVAARWPVRRANALSLAYIRRAGEPTDRIGGTLGQHAAQLLILDGTMNRFREIVRKAGALVRRGSG